MFAFDEKEKSLRNLQLNQKEKQCIDALLVASKLKQEEKQRAYAKYFEELGDIFAQRGQLLQDTRQQLKAIALYNLVLASQLPQPQADRLYEDSPILFSSLNEIQVRLVEKIKRIEAKLIQSFSGHIPKENLEDYWQKIEEVKGILRTIRQRVQNELTLVENEGITVQAIYRHIADGLKEGLIKILINRCFDCLPVPEGCIYSIIALGSLARSEATPFSDFEFAILIEDQGEEKNKIHKEYFRQLTYLLWTKVLNLRETTVRMMDITFLDWMPEQERIHYQSKLIALDWLMESTSPTIKGFSFDGQMEGGCHTPLGNMHHAGAQINGNQYELIGTPQELALFQTDEWFQKKHALTTALSTFISINRNDEKLMKSLEQEYEEKTTKILNELIVGIDKTRIQKRSLNLLAESCEKFQFRGGKFEREGHYFDVKYHLYRLPNMLIDHLAAYFDVKGKSLWERIETLFDQKEDVSNPFKKQYLTKVISNILALRLVAYLRKGYRDDHIIAFDAQHPEKNRALLTEYLSVDKEILFQTYASLICLQWATEQFINENGNRHIRDCASFFDHSFVRGWFNYLLLDYRAAAEEYEKAKQDLIDNEAPDYFVAVILSYLGEIYCKQSCYKKAIDVLEEANCINRGKLAITANNLGVVYCSVGRYKEAVEICHETLRMKEAVHGLNHFDLASTLNILGVIYRETSYYNDAIKVTERAKKIIETAYGKNHVFVADTLNNLGQIYNAQSFYDKAIVMYEEAKQIYVMVYGLIHINVAAVLNNLGLVYINQDRYQDAIKIFEEIKQIYLVVHEKNHILMSGVLNNIGLVCYKQGQYQKAEITYLESRSIREQVLGPNCIAVADVLCNLGAVYIEQSNYEKSISVLKKAKKIYIMRQLLDNINFAEIENGLGNAYRGIGLYSKALKSYKKVNHIYAKMLSPNNHQVANVLKNFGNAYYQREQYDEAIENYMKAKQIFISLFGENHVLVADVQWSMGNVYIEKKQFDEARTCYENAKQSFQKAHHIRETIAFQSLQLSSIREGNFLMLQGKIEAAIKCYSKSVSYNFSLPKTHLSLAKQFYLNNYLQVSREHYQILTRLTPHDASVYHNLSCLTHVSAQFEKDKEKMENYLNYLKEIDGYFQQALNLGAHAGIYTEYAQFILRNRSYYNINRIISYLVDAIRLNQRDQCLSYGVLERHTVDRTLQEIIDKEKQISFKAYYFAHYLLVQAYLLNYQIKEANQTLNLFEAEVVKCKEAYEEKK